MRFETNRTLRRLIDGLQAQRAMAWAKHAATGLRRWTLDRPVDEQAFLPAALEIVETPPSPIARRLSFTIMAFFFVALLWSIVGSVDVIALAPGRIVPTGRTKQIQPLEAGVIRAIHVQDGQRVKAGDVLLEIDATVNAADQDRLKQDLIQAELDAARLQAAVEPDADTTQDFAGTREASGEQLAVARTLLLNEVGEFTAKLASLDRQISQSEANRSAVETTMAKIKAALPMLKERARVRKYLAQRGYGSKIDSLNTAQDLVEHEQELQVQASRLTEATAAIEALRQQRQQAQAEYQRRNLSDLAEARRKAASLREQWVAAVERTRRQTLTAPVDGTVQQLAVHTEGGVVTPAQILLAIVPLDSHLEIEAFVSNRDIGFVTAGERAEIKVDTFNFTRYGLLGGTVMSIAQDAINRANSGNGKDDPDPIAKRELVYAARVALDRADMLIDGKTIKLSPGMAVTVEIKTGSRHVIEYLLSPLMRYRQQALRER